MWGPTLQHHCGAPSTALPPANMPMMGQQGSVFALTFFFFFPVWDVMAEAHRASLRLCLIHLWSDLNSCLGEQQLAPGLCMPQFTIVFAPPSQFHHATWPYCAI